MDATLRRFILEQLAHHNIMSLATLRADGWPQANTVAYASDGTTLYFATGGDSQKVKNIAHCNKVAATIDRDEEDWSRIKGLSIAAMADVLGTSAEIGHAADLLARKFPQLAALSPDGRYEGWAFVRLTPVVMSIIDYEHGFGHTTLVHASI